MFVKLYCGFEWKIGFCFFIIIINMFKSINIKIQTQNETIYRSKCNKIFTRSDIYCVNESVEQVRSYYQININIFDCFFSRQLLFTGRGAVIYISGGEYSMCVNSSMFYNCVCTSVGGAIYFFNSHNSFLKMVCANKCSCGSSLNGNFANLYATISNNIEYLSVSSCAESTNSFYPFLLSYGNQVIDSTNSSMNKAKQVSGFGVVSPTSFTSSFCTLSNNIVSEYVCIYFSSNSGAMSYANIVHNNSPSYGIIRVYQGATKLLYSIIYLNENTLFCVNSGSLEASHCYIDHNYTFSISNAVSTDNNNTFSKIQTYQIQFFNSFYCYAETPSPDSTPLSTINETPLITLYETHEKTIVPTPIISYDQTPINTIEHSPETIVESQLFILIAQIILLVSLVVGTILIAYSFFRSKTEKPRSSSDVDSPKIEKVSV